jgi:hypothetical protein
MLVGPVHQEEVWTRSSQREPAKSNIHISTTALRGRSPDGHSTASAASIEASKNLRKEELWFVGQVTYDVSSVCAAFCVQR